MEAFRADNLNMQGNRPEQMQFWFGSLAIVCGDQKAKTDLS